MKRVHININFLWFKSSKLFLLSFYVTLSNKIFLNKTGQLWMFWNQLWVLSCEANLAERQNPDVLPLARLLPQGKRLKLTSFLGIYLKIKYLQLIFYELLSNINFPLYILEKYFQKLVLVNTHGDSDRSKESFSFLRYLYTKNIYFDKFKMASENS